MPPLRGKKNHRFSTSSQEQTENYQDTREKRAKRVNQRKSTNHTLRGHNVRQWTRPQSTTIEDHCHSPQTNTPCLLPLSPALWLMSRVETAAGLGKGRSPGRTSFNSSTQIHTGTQTQVCRPIGRDTAAGGPCWPESGPGLGRWRSAGTSLRQEGKATQLSLQLCR